MSECGYMKYRLIKGFTVAELMIAMTVVGIISAITIPAVIGNYQKKTFVTMLQKNYSELSQNLAIMSTEKYQKSFYKSLLGTQNNAEKFFDNYYIHTDVDSFATSYGALNGGTENFTCSGTNATLKSGAAMCIINATATTPATVYLDVNGKDNPNMGGRDMFTLYIYDDYSIDDKDITPDKISNGTAETARNTLFTQSCKSSKLGEGCFGKILNDNWRMEY